MLREALDCFLLWALVLWLKANPKINLLALLISPKSPPICLRAGFPLRAFKRSIMLEPRMASPKNLSDLNPLVAASSHRFCGSASSCRKRARPSRGMPRHAFNHHSDRLAANLRDKRLLFSPPGHRTRTAFSPTFSCYNGRLIFAAILNLHDISDALISAKSTYLFSRLRPRDPPTLARRRPTSPLPIANSIFGP